MKSLSGLYKKVDIKKYVNHETGETLSSALSGLTTITVRNKNKLVISYDSYVVIDSEATKYINKEFTPAEKGRIFAMCTMISGNHNLLYNSKTNEPHTKETLMLELDLTVDRFRDFIKKLEAKLIISFFIKNGDKKKNRLFMLNPFFARKQKVFYEECTSKFQKLSPKKDI